MLSVAKIIVLVCFLVLSTSAVSWISCGPHGVARSTRPTGGAVFSLGGNIPSKNSPHLFGGRGKTGNHFSGAGLHSAWCCWSVLGQCFWGHIKIANKSHVQFLTTPDNLPSRTDIASQSGFRRTGNRCIRNRNRRTNLQFALLNIQHYRKTLTWII